MADLLAQMLWAFSIWLEAVAILPQLFMLQRTGEAETITTHYLFALGTYRALYIPNWIWRYFAEGGYVDPISVLAGIVQTVLYSDFFWIYYTKYVIPRFLEDMETRELTIDYCTECYRARSSTCQYRRLASCVVRVCRRAESQNASECGLRSSQEKKAAHLG